MAKLSSLPNYIYASAPYHNKQLHEGKQTGEAGMAPDIHYRLMLLLGWSTVWQSFQGWKQSLRDGLTNSRCADGVRPVPIDAKEL